MSRHIGLPVRVELDAGGLPCRFTGAAMATVYDAFAHSVGRVEPDGAVYDAAGQLVGQVRPDGWVLVSTGQPAAYVDATGRVFTPQGQERGYARGDGAICDGQDRYCGFVSPSVPGMTAQLIGGAGALLLFQSP